MAEIRVWPIKRLSIRMKLVLVIVSITMSISLAQIVLFSILDAQSSLQNRRVRTNAIADITGLNVLASLRFSDRQDATEILDSLKKDPAIRAAYLFSKQDGLFAHYLRPDEPFEVPLAVSGELPESFDNGSYRMLREIGDGEERLGSLYIVTDLSELIERRNSRITIGLVSALGAFALSALLAFWLQRIFTAPISALASTMKRVTKENDYTVRAAVPRDVDFATLAEGLNHMLSAIQSRDAQLAEQMEMLEQSNRELDLRVAQRTADLEATNKELESFSYSVSHDLRAPLRSIEGFSQVLLSDFDSSLDAEARRLLGIIIGDVQKMGRLIDDLLSFSRMGRQQMAHSTIDMKELAAQVFEQLRRNAPERATEFIVGDLPSATGDLSMLRQVMVNLLSNALKFAGTRPVARIEVGGAMEDGVTSYWVKDNGVGFDPRFGEKLFGVFQRLHSEDEFPGTGVGLAIVQRVIQRHGGTVSAEGQIDQGSVFRFTIPALKEE